MTELAWVDTDGEHRLLQPLWDDGERLYCRTWRNNAEGVRQALMAVLPAAEHPSSSTVSRLAHEFALKDYLDDAWAARPLELVHSRGRTLLLLESRSGSTLDSLLGKPLELGRFLRLAGAIAHAVYRLHERGLVHKDIKPTNILLDPVIEQIWLTGFGIASRMPRERRAPEPPEIIAGTLAYMSPEQTGRMNRSMDTRSDLYSLGVTLYQMLTGALPFAAADPLEWVHCHIARQPIAPVDRLTVPKPLSAIIMKLLAKNAEERYQTAAGLEADLRRCLTEWQSHGRIDPFPLGANDSSDRLLIPEKLYGREREVAVLLNAFDRVVTQGTAELVLVSGYSGVGKSTVVNELHKVLVPPRGLFAAGKFDQYKRDIPYATLAQAFQTLVRQILVKSEAEVDHRRQALLEALGPNGQLIVNLIPEVEFVIGKQPPVADLPPQEARNRFQSVFRRFLGAFATAEHPLALFLDDLQWLDTATLELLERLITDPDARHMLLIGAYRDNEVSPSHPLMRTLTVIREAGAKTQEIVLAPLGLDDVARLTAESLHCARDSVGPLARLIYEKTGGNPFFTIQFLMALAEEGLLRFDRDGAGWIWDLGLIRAKGYSDNVVDLMVGKLRRFSDKTQAALQQLACLGNLAEVAILRMVFGQSEEEIHTSHLEAVRAGLIFRMDGYYAFPHDRIQEAAYALIPEGERAAAHLRVGRVLLANMSADGLAAHLFDIASQLNRGAALLIDRDEKAQVARINLSAGRKAKASAAHASARAYFATGMALMEESDWSQQYELTFSLWLERAECEFLRGYFDEAEQLIVELLDRAVSKVDQAAVYHLKVQLHIIKSETQLAVDCALRCLRGFGIDLPAHPVEDQLQAEYEALQQTLNGRPIESLIDLPVMTDPDLLAAMRVLSALVPAARFTDHRLWALQSCRMVRVSAQHGTSVDSAWAYAHWGIVLGSVFHRNSEGYRFAKLACDLIEKHGFMASQRKVYLPSGGMAVWTQPIAAAVDFLRSGIRAAIEVGDPTFACIGLFMLISNLLLRNDPLDEVWRESEMAMDFARKARYDDGAAMFVSQQRFIATMQGRTTSFSALSDAQFDEAKFETQLTRGRMPLMVCSYWVLKLKARFLFGDYAEALAAADKARPLLQVVDFPIVLMDFFYYAALTVAALHENASADRQAAWRKLLMEHREQLREWAENYPPTFADKHTLVLAEIARLEKRDADALRLYEQAIRSARDDGFVQNEGLAHELAAQYCLARGIETAGYAYLRNARNCYLRWGADAKVRQLEERYPQIAAEKNSSDTGTILASVEQLDLATVIRVSEAVSGEIEQEKLIDTLMRTAIEFAGAERGILILPLANDYRIEAEATTGVDGLIVVLRQENITTADLPASVFQFVLRTRESLLLHDAAARSSFSTDEYIRQRGTRSVLCLPLLKQARLLGVLYLENNLAPDVFTPARMTVLKLLASAAAVSLENTRLYSDLREREARVRRLVESNIIGIFIWNVDGLIIDANDAFLHIVGHDRHDLLAGRLKWRELTPPEWWERDDQALADVKITGIAEAYEKELFRKGGERVPVLAGAAIFDRARNEGVAFMVDLSDRRRAEDAARESERRYHDIQIQLEHANRVATLGQLSVSIAHEVSQPIAGAMTNAHTALRCLRSELPDLDQVRQALTRIVRDCGRASDVVGRIRALVRKAPPQKDFVHINDAIEEVVALTHSEVVKGHIFCRMQLSSGLPVILCDRVQLQQVILNLIMNAVEALNHNKEEDREIVIVTSSDAESVRVAVRDSGPGVDEAIRERIFDAFYSTKSSGLGMGLSICRSIIEAHGGRLWTRNAAPSGAIFEFTLPVELPSYAVN